MRAKKGRGAKVLTAPPDDRQRAPPVDSLESASLSSIERASFLQGLQKKDGNPLHSTAMEEDLNLSEDGGMDRGRGDRGGIPETATSTTMKRKGAAVKRKEKETNEEEKEKKRRRKSTGERVKAGPERGGEMGRKKGRAEEKRGGSDVEGRETGQSSAPKKKDQLAPSASVATVHGLKRSVGKKPAKRTSVGQKSAARPMKNQHMPQEKKKKESESDGEMSSVADSQEESDSDPRQQNHRQLPSSDEEGDEDTSWKPSPKKAHAHGLGRAGKSSSDTPKTRKSSLENPTSSSGRRRSADTEKINKDQQRKKKHGRPGGTELEVVLDAFLSFCDQHRESVESTAVIRAIDSFSSCVKEQLVQKMTSSQELRALRRENAKVKSLIRTKRQRLLDAKNELMRAERQLSSLQKEEAQLNRRLTDLRQGQDFLHNFSELTTQYLDYRRKHPKEKEEYGATSLPALLLETQHILEASNSQPE